MQQRLQHVIASISAEIRDLATQTNELQHELSGTDYERPDVVTFQSLDSITQTLFCLSDFMAELGTELGCQCEVPLRAALDRVCLAQLAQRLEGRTTASRAPDPECELWG